ncbi:putative sulfatase [uncultured Eubacteriales bacterium]|uniref:Putative sulfatase n=1 Tax=uncultured Eubacteriales bacterium TaxID=172733 RepID=A0A212JRY0_9FIRM|nr:putative sulfatase [uncultured Eubacteriales bacterium]
MKAIMVMYDSLRRDLLSCNGGPIPTPNFERLAARTVQFDRSYVGSLPCMPARRELHTGRYNFLHRSWGPVEPFDDSMPQILKQHGVYTHLTTDHYHYIEDGGATYHSRYSTWACYRGQETDAWVADLTPSPAEYSPHLIGTKNMNGTLAEMRRRGGWQNDHNRERLHTEADYPMRQTFDNGLDFLDRNGRLDNWFLQIETFDPHEPFNSPEAFEAKYFSPDEPFVPDWPPYAKVDEDEATVEGMRKKYFALTCFCDQQLGRVLDKMDELDLWKDTMLIINTDHGFFLAEHDWWGKGASPNYEELVHTPLFVWDPRCGTAGQRSSALVQTIDLAPTLLDFFGVEVPADMLGRPLGKTVAENTPVREYAMFGYHGGPLGITDGRYTLLRAVADFGVQMYEYTHMPTHMRGLFPVEEMKTATMAAPFSFTKGAPVMKIEARVNPRFARAQEEGEDLLFDLRQDPAQERPLEDEAVKARLLAAAAALLAENDAPAEVYARYGLKRA